MSAPRYSVAVAWITPAGYGYTSASDPEAHGSILSMDASDAGELLWAAEYVAARRADSRPSWSSQSAHVYVIQRDPADELAMIRTAEAMRQPDPATIRDRVCGRLYPDAAPSYCPATDPRIARLIADSDTLELLLAGERTPATLELNARLGEPFDPEPIE